MLLPNSNGVAMSLLGLLSAGRVAAMINYTAGPANVTAAVRTAVIRTVVSSRAFIEKAGLDDIVEAAEQAGAKFVWLEDLRERHLAASRSCSRRCCGAGRSARQDADKPAVILFTSGSEGTPKAVVLSQPQPARQRHAGRGAHCAVGRRTSCSTCCRSSIPSG